MQSEKLRQRVVEKMLSRKVLVENHGRVGKKSSIRTKSTAASGSVRGFQVPVKNVDEKKKESKKAGIQDEQKGLH